MKDEMIRNRIEREYGVREISLGTLYHLCGYATDEDSPYEEYSYSCSHPDNPDTCAEYDGNCIACYCPIALLNESSDDEEGYEENQDGVQMMYLGTEA